MVYLSFECLLNWSQCIFRERGEGACGNSNCLLFSLSDVDYAFKAKGHQLYSEFCSQVFEEQNKEGTHRRLNTRLNKLITQQL